MPYTHLARAYAHLMHTLRASTCALCAPLRAPYTCLMRTLHMPYVCLCAPYVCLSAPYVHLCTPYTRLPRALQVYDWFKGPHHSQSDY